MINRNLERKKLISFSIARRYMRHAFTPGIDQLSNHPERELVLMFPARISEASNSFHEAIAPPCTHLVFWMTVISFNQPYGYYMMYYYGIEEHFQERHIQQVIKLSFLKLAHLRSEIQINNDRPHRVLIHFEIWNLESPRKWKGGRGMGKMVISHMACGARVKRIASFWPLLRILQLL